MPGKISAEFAFNNVVVLENKYKKEMKYLKMTVLLAFASVMVASCACNGRRDVMVGGYGKAGKLTAQEDSLFTAVVKNEAGLQLRPLKVSRQVVAGTNYRFECVDADRKKVEVVVYQPLPCYNEKARITSINDKPYTK